MITLRPYQQDLISRLRDSLRAGAKRPLVVSPTGSGKCLAKGTPVMLFCGRVVPVEQICVGDLLMGPDSLPRRVESLARGSEMMYRVSPKKGDPYTVNESHILSLKMTNKNELGYADGEVVNLSVREYLGKNKTFKHCAKGWRATVDFKAHSDPLLIPAYMMGAWLGDGSSRHFSLTTGDVEIAEEFCAYVYSLGMKLRIDRNSNGSVVMFAVGSGRGFIGRHGGPLGNALRHYGVRMNKHIPHRYKTGTRQERLDLLAGIIDTDGHNTGSGFDLTLKSERLLDDVIFVARSLGLSAYKAKARKVCTNNGKTGTYWRCNINGDIDQIPCRVERKKAGPRKQIKNPLVTGIAVEPVGFGEYYGFELSGPDRLFLLGDFTVTHNTVMFSYLAAGMTARRHRVWLICHREKLQTQIQSTLARFGIESGRIAAGHPYQPELLAQVCSIQTLARRNIAEAPDWIIPDECHHVTPKSQYGQVLARYPSARVLGFTATPCRLDGSGLGETFDDMIVGPSVRELIDLGALCEYRLYQPKVCVDLSGVRRRAGDFAREEIDAAMDKPSVTGDALAHYRKLCDGLPAVGFCVSVAHAVHSAEQFRAGGYNAAVIHGGMSQQEQDAVSADFEQGRLNVLMSCDMISEGYDVPAMAAAILLRPTQSVSLFLQQCGRPLRIAPGKTEAIILDHAGNSSRPGLGMPCDPREWTLEGAKSRGSKRDAAESPVRQCPTCYAISKAAAKVCRECGQEFPITAREIEQREGELIEAAKMQQKRDARREQGRAQTLEDLMLIEKAKGYKPGWARHVWNSRQGRRA